MTSAKRIRDYAKNGTAFRRWYVLARGVVRRLADTTDKPVGMVADILAITSPRCVVTRNLRVTYAYLRGEPLPGDVMRSTRAALKHWELTGKIRGPKTSAFALVLRGDDSRCVIDSHIARAFGYHEKQAALKWVRDIIAAQIVCLANNNGWTVAETQAMIWAGYYKATYPTGRVPRYRMQAIVPF